MKSTSQPTRHISCELTGLTELNTNPNYATVRPRAKQANELVPKLHAALQARSALEWEQVFGEKVPNAAVRPIQDMFDFPQVIAEGMVVTNEHPVVGTFKSLARPVKFSATPGPLPSTSPGFGEHSRQILSEAGYSEEEIEALHLSGAVMSGGIVV